MDRNIPRKIYNRLLVCFFILVFFAPAVRMFSTDRVTFSFTEKRILADFPSKPESLSHLQSFFSGIDTFLNDHFGFREFLIYRYQREVRKRFGITGDQAIVHQGTDDWLFLGTPEMMFDYAGKKRISKIDMDNWLKEYSAKRDWLATRGIPYLLVAAPDKQSVYPEYVMKEWRDVHAPGVLEQFIVQHPEIAQKELLNLGEILSSRKDEDLLYYKTGTHWTQYGSYIAYLQIAEKVEALLPGISFKKDFSFSEPTKRTCLGAQDRCGDLILMLLDCEPIEETFRRIQPYKSCAENSPLPYPVSNLPGADAPSMLSRCPEKKFRAVVFRDSFFSALFPYFSENFGEAIYLWKSYDQQNMEEILTLFKPDIVVEEVVERNLF